LQEAIWTDAFYARIVPSRELVIDRVVTNALLIENAYSIGFSVLWRNAASD
jgi:hypothetical protein